MAAPNVSMQIFQVTCSNCNMREFCLPMRLTLREIEQVEDMVAARKRVRRGGVLYRAGNHFDAVYAIRLGFLKSVIMSSDGKEQITSFHMAGEMVGLDGVASNVHSCDVVALEDTEVCVIPYEQLLEVASTLRPMTSHYLRLFSREIVRQRGIMLLLGSMRAEERLAAFLLNLSQKFESRGYSRSEFVLRMTREEIGSYLGLKLETVSRVLSRFSHSGLIQVNQKHVQILNASGLRAIVSGQEARDDLDDCEP